MLYLLYADDLVLRGESEESLRRLVEGFGRVCKRRGLKVNGEKSKVMVVSRENVQCRIMLDGEILEQVSEFKYLGYVMNEKGTDDAECNRKVSNGRKMAGAIKTLVNAKGLDIECTRVLHEAMLVQALMYGSEVMVWEKKYRTKVQAVQMDNLRGMLGVRRIDKMRNERIRELCGVKKGMNERINECVLSWFGHMERMEESRLVKRVYSGECEGNNAFGRPKKKWIGSVRDCLGKRGMNLDEARRMVGNRSEWRGFCNEARGRI